MGQILGSRGRKLTRLDLWLAVVLYAWIGDVALSGIVNAGRYDLGWYAGRLFGFFSVSLVLSEVLWLALGGTYPRPRE
jgi:two-component system, sensor histidine kinase and response regulator